MSGAIQVQVNYARQLYDTETFGTMDPYCQIELGSSKFKTKVAKSGGRNPTWNEGTTMLFSGQKEMIFQVLDKDTMSSDDFVGSATISLDGIKASPGGKWCGDLQLYRKGSKQAGTLNVLVDMSGIVGQQPAYGLPAQQQAQVPAYAQPNMMQQQPQQQMVYAQGGQPQYMMPQPGGGQQVVYAQPGQPQVVYAGQPQMQQQQAGFIPQQQVIYAQQPQGMMMAPGGGPMAGPPAGVMGQHLAAHAMYGGGPMDKKMKKQMKKMNKGKKKKKHSSSSSSSSSSD